MRAVNGLGRQGLEIRGVRGSGRRGVSARFVESRLGGLRCLARGIPLIGKSAGDGDDGCLEITRWRQRYLYPLGDSRRRGL
jgi:hypothetical protein